MTDYGPSPLSSAFDVKPHAFDPYAEPELFEGVLVRRMAAFVIDLFIIAAPLAMMSIFILMLGFLTLGLGWLLFHLLSPISIVWAVLYYGLTLGGPASATIGMRLMGLEMRTWYGAPAYFVLGAVHAVVYWLSITLLSPLILLVGPCNARKRLLHDMLVGAVVINSAPRAAWVPARGRY